MNSLGEGARDGLRSDSNLLFTLAFSTSQCTGGICT